MYVYLTKRISTKLIRLRTSAVSIVPSFRFLLLTVDA